MNVDRDESVAYFQCQKGRWEIEMSEEELAEYRAVENNYWAYQDLIERRIHDRRADVPNP